MTQDDEETIRAIGAGINTLPPEQRAVCESAIKEIAGIVLRDGVAGRLALAMVGASVAAADLELRDITAVAECTPAAVTAWESAPWTK